jgi:hypothetical protein
MRGHFLCEIAGGAGVSDTIMPGGSALTDQTSPRVAHSRSVCVSLAFVLVSPLSTTQSLRRVQRARDGANTQSRLSSLQLAVVDGLVRRDGSQLQQRQWREQKGSEHAACGMAVVGQLVCGCS